MVNQSTWPSQRQVLPNDIARTASPAPFGNTAANGTPILDPSQSATLHPEFGPGSTFGLPQPGKDADTLQKEQLGLKLSFETRLKMIVVEQALVATNFDYQKAFEAAGKAFEEGRLGGRQLSWKYDLEGQGRGKAWHEGCNSKDRRDEYS